MKWSLKELYPSFDGEKFLGDLELFKHKIKEVSKWCDANFESSENSKEKLEAYIRKISELKTLESRLGAFTSLTLSANAKDEVAKRYEDIIDKEATRIVGMQVMFSNWLGNLTNLEEIVKSSDILKEYKFFLKETIKENKYILSEKEETIISKMKLTGSSAWLSLKNNLASNHTVDIEMEGEIKKLGINKVKNMSFSNDGDLRKKAFYAEKESNKNIAEAVCAALNGIKGEVITLSELKGYKSPLHKTLENSRMDEKTLNTMLKVMEENLGEFQKYFLKKAQLLGHEGKLPYYDIMAPVGNANMNFTYEEAKDFIVKHFTSFSKDMGDLALKAFENNWIDAEVREGKRSGAFCSNLHCIKESRILSSFSGSFKNVCTLAHELGHAYHGSILQKESVLNSHYPMPLAETASIFAENIVRNAALETADKDEAMVILGAELVNCSSVIVDIYARFLFETKFFKKRKEAYVTLEETKKLMLGAQKIAYGEAILEGSFDEFAWVHKPHYYYSSRNFYNFPYAFGLLFSKGLYALYLKEGKSFVDKYKEVLRLTGQADIYDVAKYIGINIHDEEFWRGSMEIIKKDIEKFCNI